MFLCCFFFFAFLGFAPRFCCSLFSWFVSARNFFSLFSVCCRTKPPHSHLKENIQIGWNTSFWDVVNMSCEWFEQICRKKMQFASGYEHGSVFRFVLFTVLSKLCN